MDYFRLILALVALAFSAPSHSMSVTTVNKYGIGFSFPTSSSAQAVGSNSLAVASRSLAATSAGDVTILDGLTTVLGGETIAPTLARTILASALPEIALAAAAAGGYVAGTAIYDYLNTANVQYNPDSGYSTMQGANTSASTLYYISDGTYAATRYSSREASCNSYAAWYLTVAHKYAGISTPATSVTHTTGTTTCTAVATFPNGTKGTAVVYFTLVSGSTYCVAIDTLAYSGINATGGLCPSGTSTPITTSAAKTLLSSVSPPAPQSVVSEALAKGVTATASSAKLSGPSSGTPKTVTTTNNDGSTVTQAITNNYTYSGDTITYNTTNISTTKAADGTTTNTTTTTSSNTSDTRSECEKSPDTIGCSLYGDLPTDAPTWSSKTVTWSSDDLGMSGSCPAKTIISIRSWSLPIDYTPACNVAPTISYGLQLLTALGCMLFIVQAVKT